MNRPRLRLLAAPAAIVLLLMTGHDRAGAAPPTARERFDELLSRHARPTVTAPSPPPVVASTHPQGFGSSTTAGKLDLGRATPADMSRLMPAPSDLRGARKGGALPTTQGIFLYPVNIAVASAGDVDGNGSTDWIKGDPYLSPNGSLIEAGRVTIYKRTPSSTSEVVINGGSTSEYFGGSVASAGDINGDGYDEVIVGAPGFQNGNGRAYIYRGSPSGTITSLPWIIEGVAPYGFLGFDVAGAGDVNGDGYDDVLVSSPGFSGSGLDYQGLVFCYLGGVTGPASTPAWTMEGTASFEFCGWSIAGNGDINADGYADVLLGSPGYSDGQAGEGRARLYLGGPSGLQTTAAWSYEPNAADWGTGQSVALPGDLNGDGYGDIVIGSPFADYFSTGDGAVTIFGGSPFTFFLPQLNELGGGDPDMQLGFDVAAAGDLNGDGYADFLASAPYFGTDEGLWVEWYGSPLIETFGSYLPYFGAPGTRAGTALAGGGDVGDGVTDILVGLYNAPLPPAPGTPNPDAPQGGGPIIPTFLAGHGVTFDEIGYIPTREFAAGSFNEYGFGSALALADVNGDGHADVIVGGPNYGRFGGADGHVHAYHGTAAGFDNPFPFPIAGTAETQGGGPVAGVVPPSWTYESPNPDANFGFSVANAGDVNGDGYEDVIVGAPTATYGENAEGAAYLFLGGPEGLETQPAWRTEGNSELAFHGYSVGAAGDVNQDGYDDVLVGAPLADPGAVEDAGTVSLYYGSPSGPAHTPVRVFAGSGTEFFLGATCAGIGDVDGDGYPEIAMAEPGYSNGEVEEGRVLAYKGGATGVAALPFFAYESNIASSGFGWAVAPAGDVNGDGHADLLAGAYLWTDTISEQGALFLFAGSPLGLAATPTTTILGQSVGAQLGTSAWAAGDLNKDGYGEIIVGSPGWLSAPPAPGGLATAGGLATDGRAEVYFGSSGGLELLPRHSFDVFSTGLQGILGQAVAGGGDINGDGWPDVVYSAPYEDYGKNIDNGIVATSFSNIISDGLDKPVRMLRTDNVTPIAPGLRSDSPSAFRLASLARTPVGRGRVRLQWQASPWGANFNAAPIASSTALRTSLPNSVTGSSIALGGNVTGLSTGGRYRWRARYATRHPNFQRSRWYGLHSNGVLETDLRTAGPTGAVDVPGGATSALSFAGAWPNPLGSSGAALHFALPAAGRVTIDAYNAQGRRVARVLDADAAAGPGATVWDGRDDAGRALPRGLYFLRLGFAGEEMTAKAVIAR